MLNEIGKATWRGRPPGRRVWRWRQGGLVDLAPLTRRMHPGRILGL